ncbi:zinc-dependent alcohol dehydrogenase family protein [Pseudoclavibacter sp. CFCC 14310]|uniref:zinc-dependent alcohol dehydrogenase family protein n=1 Tax=Pseudoclavibacter sp. CFCC 14310 TaxID=2615180 RepID=UPI001301757F|nr:zinc-dependent alcohol dehydrogenase family protein [Pseudoclavibacter sp. CFCC 14310]KAB1647044.1 zinc-dependent alcohol dehydrogenase family protein [Pseudoclavibacter sp. CFCC 14310]
MKGLVYGGPGVREWKDVPDPVIEKPTDVLVKMEATTICGSDLHVLKGDVPETPVGTVLGHEGVGVVTEVGDAVSSIKVGDRLLLSCMTTCGHCANCRKGLLSHCLGDEGAVGDAWAFGHYINGTQAEYVRVPYAETSSYRIPAGVSDRAAILLSDILPTGFEIGVQNGQVKPGDTVAIIGAGPVGLAAVATAGLQGAAKIISVDLDDNRLARAKEFGATAGVNSGAADWKEQLLAFTDGEGVDVAMEAVGIPPTLQMATEIVRPGGHVANIGVHGKPVEIAMQKLWTKNIGITMGLVNTTSLEMLLNLVAAGKLDVENFVTHEFSFDEFEKAYDVFANAAETKALKVLIR